MIGRESSDIDFAIDDMTGAEFVKLLNEYRVQSTDDENSKFEVISYNSEETKQLDKVKVKILDTFVDVVNLRSEVYSSNSRIPQTVINDSISG